MKKLLVSSALCLVFSTGLSSVAQALPSTSPLYSASEVSIPALHPHALLPDMGLYHGDFQKITRSVNAKPLYTGSGSALMPSLRDVTD